MTTYDQTPERQEIEALLPWHATGTLAERDAQRVEEALAQDRELSRRYALVREELAATVRLNDALGAPPAGAMERLMLRIEAESPTGRSRQALGGLTEWLATQVGGCRYHRSGRASGHVFDHPLRCQRLSDCVHAAIR
jgi:anti-sigma-K factor RskA